MESINTAMEFISELLIRLGIPARNLDAAAETFGSEPLLFFGSFFFASSLVGSVYMLMKRKRRNVIVEPPSGYMPATLPIEEERVPLVQEGSKREVTFRDVGVCGGNSVIGGHHND